MKSRYLWLLVGALITGIAGHAETLSPTEALLRAQGSLPAKVKAANPGLNSVNKSLLVYTLEDSLTAEPALYAFNQSTRQGGWMIVPADDRAVPLLAVSDHGTLEPDSFPPAMQALLQQYQNEIKWARNRRAPANNNYPPGFGRPHREDIAPLCSSRWNQGAPYNLYTPKKNNIAHTMTGCVATAMAQVMYFHRWPLVGQGSNEFTTPKLNMTVSMDFSQVPFDWANMQDTYVAADTTNVHGQAVATLMNACGHSVNMEWNTGSSAAVTANIAKAFAEYFNYDPSVDYVRRNNYSLLEWESLIYESLRDYGPVQMGGGNDDGGGHSFVCDGIMMNCLFHYNWG